MGLWDQVLKTVLREAPEGLLRMALGQDVELGEALPTEIQWRDRRLDHLRRIRRSGQDALLLVEVKAEASAELSQQLFGYYAQVLQAHEFAAVLPLAIVLRPGGSTGGEQPLALSALGQPVCHFAFAVLRVHEIPVAQALAGGQPGLLALVPLMAGAQASSVLDASQKLASARLRVPVQADLQAVLVLLAATRFGLQDIQRLIPEEVYMNSPLYEEILERGRLKGLEEGKQEGIRSSLEQLLARKLGAPIPSRTKAKLQALSDDQLTELLLLIGDAGSPAAVREVLKTALRSRS